MRLNGRDAADVLTRLIQEDRTETRIYRSRVENVIYTLAVASFAISAFLISKVPHISQNQLRDMTLLIDLGIVAVILVFFCRIKTDMVMLRKTLKGRQDLMNCLDEGEVREIDPFQSFKEVKPDIKDTNLYWEAGLPIGVILMKMLVLIIYAGRFIS